MSRAGWVILLYIFGFGLAQAADEGVVRVPGAFAEVGWNGRLTSGGWVEFRLVATAAGAFYAKLETTEGKVLEGLTPITANLELPEGVGTRETRLILPIMTTRMVKITISGATGSAVQRFEPSNTALELNASRLPIEPSLYLTGHRILGRLEPSIALATLAGGAHLELQPTGLPVGALGLGAITKMAPHKALLEQLAAFAPEASPPARHHELLGFWSVAAFVVLLGLLSLKRFDFRYLVAIAIGSIGLGGLGFWASLPSTSYVETTRDVLIGARGWGVKFQLHSRYSLQPEWNLPAGALPLEQNHIARQYSNEKTVLQHAGWQKIRYVTMPTATRVPLRLEANKLVNESPIAVEQIFVRGRGNQEVLEAGSSRVLTNKIYGTLPPDQYLGLLQVLPDGTVIAQQANTTMIIALPEQP